MTEYYFALMKEKHDWKEWVLGIILVLLICSWPMWINAAELIYHDADSCVVVETPDWHPDGNLRASDLVEVDGEWVLRRDTTTYYAHPAELKWITTYVDTLFYELPEPPQPIGLFVDTVITRDSCWSCCDTLIDTTFVYPVEE